MPSINLHPPSACSSNTTVLSALPQLLQTPSGLAIVEIQGTLNVPSHDSLEDPGAVGGTPTHTPVGRLVFPLYNANTADGEGTAWMKQVYLYVGKHQRLTGEAKKLPKPLAVLRKRESKIAHSGDMCEDHVPGEREDALEIVQIIRYKILFASRPEPVGE